MQVARFTPTEESELVNEVHKRFILCPKCGERIWL